LRADVCDAPTTMSAVRQADIVFHLSAVSLGGPFADPMRRHLVNDQGSLNVLLAARDARVERFVYVSTSEVYGSARWVPMDEDHPTIPTTTYAASKLAGEAMTFGFHHTYGLPTIVVRPFNVYGPGYHDGDPGGDVITRFTERAIAGRPMVVFGDGLQTRDFAWVEDAVRGIVLAAECDQLVGDCVNIARGEEVSVLRLAQQITDLTGSRAPIVHVRARPGDIRRQEANVDRAHDILGFDAGVGIKDGLRRYVDWVKARPGPGADLNVEEVSTWQSSATLA
jgi:UDP-glucose 4-epimerase